MTTWDVDTSHSSISFSVRHMMFAKVHGRFGKFAASVEMDDAQPTRARVNATIETASIETHEPKRDAHLRSADFFDADKYPTITFEGAPIERVANKFQLKGTLTMHGVARDVVLEVERLGATKDPWGKERVAFEATASLDRKEWGLKWNQALETGGVLVGDKVEVAVEVQLVKRETAADSRSSTGAGAQAAG